MKKYCFIYKHHGNNKFKIKFILAKDVNEAKEVAILLMKIESGNSYSEKDIRGLFEITEDKFVNMEDLNKLNNEIENFMQQIINDIDNEEDNDNG